MRRTTSSAHPSAAHTSPASAAAAAAAADDSFSELGVDDAASMRAPSGPADLDEASEGFSEPEDWELQSTDGSALGDDDDDDENVEGERAGAGQAAALGGAGVSASAADGEEAVVVQAPQKVAHADSPSQSKPKEAVDEGWLGVEAERST